MCMFGGTPSLSEPKAPATPKENSGAVGDAAELERKRRMAAGGLSGSILTGPLGDSSGAPVTKKTLLGQ